MAFEDGPPRHSFFYGLVGDRGAKLCVWGGLSEEMSDFWYGGEEGPITRVTESVLTFLPWQEKWTKPAKLQSPLLLLPPGQRNGACAASGRYLYTYGGSGKKMKSPDSGACSVHRLDTETWEWSRLDADAGAGAAPGAPKAMDQCEMVVWGDKLVLYGRLLNGALADSVSDSDSDSKDEEEKGAGVEKLHVFDLTKRVWSSPKVTGKKPPPRVVFSFTKVGNRVVLFGGLQLENEEVKCDVHILDLEKMHWTELEKADGAPWPEKRLKGMGTCLGEGTDKPQLLLVGGLTPGEEKGSLKGCKNMWILDLEGGKWREVEAENLVPRGCGCAVALDVTPSRTDVVVYGGSPDMESPVADTTIAIFECSSAGEWVLTELADKTKLGSSERVKAKKPFAPEVDFDLLEPDPRQGHFQAFVVGPDQGSSKLRMWGGKMDDVEYMSGGMNMINLVEYRKHASVLHCFDTKLEGWSEETIKGDVVPAGFYSGACAASGNSLFTFGGVSLNTLSSLRSKLNGSLYRLDLKGMEWSQLATHEADGAPMKKMGCEMVAFDGDDDGGKLLLFGGLGTRINCKQEGASFAKSTDDNNLHWSDELNVFDLKEGVWSSPEVTGDRPLPCSDFSLTKVDDHHAVLVTSALENSTTPAAYVVDLLKMHWTQLKCAEGEAWPEDPLMSPNGVCLEYGGERPQLLVMGLSGGKKKTFPVVWTLDVNARKWTKVEVPESLEARLKGKYASGLTVSSTRVDVVLFGGCNIKASTLADTTRLRFEKQENEWVLAGVADNKTLGKKK